MRRGTMILIITIIALLAIPPTIAIGEQQSQTQPPAAQQITLKGDLSHIFNLLTYKLQTTGIDQITNGILIPGTNMIAVTGQDGYALYQVNTGTRTITLLTNGSIIGSNLLVFTDSQSLPSWIGFAQDSGEILLVNATNYDYTLSYYTASRKGPVTAHLETYNGTSKLVAVDSEGYAYIFTVNEPYWLEIGPGYHDTALASLPYMFIKYSAPVQELHPDGSSHNSDKTLLMADPAAFYYYGNITLTLLYYNIYNSTVEPAKTGTAPLGNNTTVVSNVYFIFNDTNGLAFYTMTNPGDGPTYTLNSVPAGIYTLTAIYQKIYINATTSQVEAIDWYTASTEVTVIPGLNVSIGSVTATYFTSGNYTYSYIAGLQNIYVPGPTLTVDPYLALNLTKLNETTIYDIPAKGTSHWLSFFPVPVDAGEIVWYKIYKPTTKPATWPANAEYLMIAATEQNLVLIYMLDANLTPIRFGGSGIYYEKIYLGSALSSEPAVSPDTTQLYLGSESGYILKLVWLPAQQKYVGSNAYILDSAAVQSLSYNPATNKLFASSRSGIVQLLDTANWKPLWRGMPGFYGINTMMANLLVNSKGSSYLVGIAPGLDMIAVMYNPEIALYSMSIKLNITLTDLQGNVSSVTPPPGSTALILDAGTPVAKSTITEDGVSIFYLPAGVHTLNITLPSIGYVEKTYNLTTGIEDTIKIGLRAYRLGAYTPPSIGDPKRDPGYYLVHGPKPGTNLQVEPYAYDADLGYTPSPVPVTATTNVNGSVVVVLWDGVVYQVTGSLEGYTSGVAFTSLYGVGSMNLTMNPDLYKVTFNIYDNDTAGVGAPLYLSSQITLYYTANGRNITLPITTQGDYYYLPSGQYIIQAKAPHYMVSTLNFQVANQPVTLNIGLQAETYLYKLTVYQVDTTGLNIGNGPMSSAQVNVTMVWPVPGMIRVIQYTGPDGTLNLALRYGIYRVTITHPYGETKTISLYLTNNTASITNIDLKASVISLYFKDSQFTLYGITNVTVTLSYQGSTWTSNYTFTTGNRSIITLTVPYGVYAIIADAKYYQTYVETLEIAETSLLKTVYMDPAMATVRVQVAYSPIAGNLSEGPVQGALVKLKLVTPNIPTGNISAVTGPDGIAVFYVRQGVYDISVTSKYTKPRIDKNVEIVGDTLVPEAVMPETANITVIVVDAESSALIPNTTLIITKTMPGVEKTITFTLKNGSLSTVLPAGIYQIKASYPGRYYEAQQQIDLTAGSQLQLSYSLVPMKGALQLTLLSNETTAKMGEYEITLPSVPIPNASIKVEPVDSLLRSVYNVTYTGTTDLNGQFIITDLRSGQYRLTIKVPGYPLYSTIITINPESAITLQPTLTPYTSDVNIAVIDTGLSDIYVKNYTLTLISYNYKIISANLTLPGPVKAKLPTGMYQFMVYKQYYYPANISIIITGQSTQNITVNLTPITVNTTAVVNVVETAGVSGQVTTGLLEFHPKTWNLATPQITSKILGGTSLVTLRLGTYDVYLNVPWLNLKTYLGEVQITQSTVNIELSVTPPTYNIQLNLVDSDLVSPIYGAARVTMIYNGPFGTGSLSIEVTNGTATIQGVPGNYSIDVASDFYEAYREQTTISGPKSLVLVLTPVRIQTTINLVDIDENPVTVPNVTITFIHKETGETVGALLIQGKIVPLKGLRLGVHEVNIVPPEDAPINVTRTLITVTTGGPSTNTITALPRLFTLKIVLLDPVTGQPANLKFQINVQRSGNPASEFGLPVTAETSNGTLILHVPYGVYTVTVTGGPDSYFVDPAPQTILVSKDTELTITLEPKTYRGTVLVTDDRNNPIQGALVVVTNAKGNVVASGMTDATGTFAFTGVYGPYTIQVSANGFKPGTTALYLPTQAEATVQLQPTPATVLKRYSVLIIGVIGIVGVAAGLYLARGKILERLQEEEEYF